MKMMHYADLTLSPDQYDRYLYRGYPYLLQLATQMGLIIPPDQLKQDLLFTLLAFPTESRLRFVFFSCLILIYYFHRLKALPLDTLFRRFHLATSTANMIYYHRLCELKNPTENRLTQRQTEFKIAIENIRQCFQLSDDCIEFIVKLCSLPHVQNHLPRHVVAAAVLSTKSLYHLKGITTADLTAWAHCCSTTLTHLKRYFMTHY